MMRQFLSCIAAAATVVLPAPAEAGFYSGADLFKSCTTERSDPGYVERTYECIAYVAGAVDAFNTTREANKLKSCIPAKVTMSRLKEVTVDYLRSHPTALKASASKAVFTATRTEWPCKKK